MNIRSSVRSAARGVARAISPVLNKIGLMPVLYSIETYIAFLAGRGSGSGWDTVNEVKTIASFVRRSPAIIFDIGANNGAWSLQLAQHLDHPDNSFFLVECAPYCFEGIERRLSSIPNPTVVKIAVSDKDGVATLHLPTRGSGLASLHERGDSSIVQYDYEILEVPAQTLDTLAASFSIDRIDLLKMDIEGHELFALKGATLLLNSNSISVITFEFGSANINSQTTFRDFWKILKAHKYFIYRIIPGGGVIEINNYSDELEYYRGATNYIATLCRAPLI